MDADDPVGASFAIAPDKAQMVREIAEEKGVTFIQTLSSDEREVIFTFNLEDENSRGMLFALPRDVFAKVGVVESSTGDK